MAWKWRLWRAHRTGRITRTSRAFPFNLLITKENPGHAVEATHRGIPASSVFRHGKQRADNLLRAPPAGSQIRFILPSSTVVSLPPRPAQQMRRSLLNHARKRTAVTLRPACGQAENQRHKSCIRAAVTGRVESGSPTVANQESLEFRAHKSALDNRYYRLLKVALSS